MCAPKLPGDEVDEAPSISLQFEKAGLRGREGTECCQDEGTTVGLEVSACTASSAWKGLSNRCT